MHSQGVGTARDTAQAQRNAPARLPADNSPCRFTLAQGFTGSEQGTARTRAPLDQALLVSSSWAAAATKSETPSPNSPPQTYNHI